MWPRGRVERESHSFGTWTWQVVPPAVFPKLILQQRENNSDGDENCARLEIITVLIELEMNAWASDKETLFQTWICLYIKQVLLRPLTQHRRYFWANRLQMFVGFGRVREGVITDFSTARITSLGLSGDILGSQVWPQSGRMFWQDCGTQQLPAEQIQSTAAWLRERQIGRTLRLPQKSAGISAILANWSILNT